MDRENDLIVAYVAGYSAAMYDSDKKCLSENTNDIIEDAKKWLGLMLKTGAIGRG